MNKKFIISRFLANLRASFLAGFLAGFLARLLPLVKTHTWTKKSIPQIAIFAIILIASSTVFFVSCAKGREEVNIEDVQAMQDQSSNNIIANTISKSGPPIYKEGVYGGTLYSYINSDPKSFNTLHARETFTAAVTNYLYPTLFLYNAYKREFEADNADFEIEYDEAAQETRVTIKLRDDLYWTNANGRKEKITSDDVVFWYNEVDGDKAVQSPGYSGQFITKPDGTKSRITIEKIDALRAQFVIPVIIANPLLYVNMSFGPYYLFKPAKDANKVSGMLDILSIDTDPKTVPSAGKYMLTEYLPGQYVELEKNPNYWKKDAFSNQLPYIQKINIKIIASDDTALLSFQKGALSRYGARPEDLDSLLKEQPAGIYDIYNSGASLSSAFLTLNQNPHNIPAYKHLWFSNKYFRQAMSTFMPRERIAKEVYRGLAEPTHYFFAKANIFYDPDISLSYTYNVARGHKLLARAGFKKNKEGLYQDGDGNLLEFDLIVGVQGTVLQDTASLFVEELKNAGVTVNLKPIDFQNLVEKLTKSYDWDAVIVRLGANYWPSGGSNVWQSNGNFHLWYPLQESPATDWEKEIDDLYQKGLYTVDMKERKKVYDEYQKIILEQVPLIYTVYSNNFVGYNKKMKNVFVDNLDGSDIEYLYLTE